MNSRLLAKMESRIASADGAEKEELCAERAGYLARAGQIDVASAEVMRIRQVALRPGDSRLSAALNLAEGFCHYYKNMSPVAEDRFSRARAIAELGGHDDLAARAASWLGLIKYGEYNFEEMIRWIDASVEGGMKLDSLAASRSCLTIALTLHLANRFDLAFSWYRRTHLLAVQTEDEVMISAMLHNMASIWASNVRNARLGRLETFDSSRQAFLGTLSTFNFDDLVGISTLSVFTPLLEAQIHSLELNYGEALSLYESSLSGLDVKAVEGWQNWLLADRAWCRLQAGNKEGIREILESIRKSVSHLHHEDDRAATLQRLSQSWSALGEVELAEDLDQEARSGWSSFSALQDEMVALVLASRGCIRLADRLPI